MTDLTELARGVREHPGLVEKRHLRHVAETVGGDGDDAALVPASDGVSVLAAEAIRPQLVLADPRVAGIAGVVTVLNDIAATGGRPSALLDTVVGPEGVVREVLEGVAIAAKLYGVPVVGGHTTVQEGEAGLSTFALGAATKPLLAANARPGDTVCLAVCLDGELVTGPDGSLFFSHLRGERRSSAAADLALIAEAAESGDAWSGRDVSMPGLVGSLIQFAESAGGLGCRIDIDAVPVPTGVTLDEWVRAFASYAFLLVGHPQRLAERFSAAGLSCTPIGQLNDTGLIQLVSGDSNADVWNLRDTPLTALG